MGEDFSCMDAVDGDVKLCVIKGENQRMFRVSSKVMRLASPVWRVMLDPQGHFLESAQADDREITFHDDSARALEILLSIIHLKFSDVPNTITFDELLDLSYLCDKYCMIEIVRPWLEGWLGPLKKTVGISGYEGWLFIAWTIGDEDIMRRAAEELTTNATTNEHEQYLSTINEPVRDNMPPGIIEEIKSIRLKTIAGFLAICQRLVNRYGAEDGNMCVQDQNENECDVIVFGSLIKGLQALGMWPLAPDAAAIHTSINKLSKKLKAIKCYSLPTDSGYDSSDSDAANHEFCGFRSEMEKSVNDLVQGMPSAVLPHHVRHMEEQRKKLG